MTITPDMLSRPPGEGEVFCFIHGIGTFKDGACAECIELMKDESIVACPAHGIQTKNAAGSCPHCPPEGPPKPKMFDPPPDVAPQGVSTKPGYERPAPAPAPPKPPRRTA